MICQLVGGRSMTYKQSDNNNCQKRDEQPKICTKPSKRREDCCRRPKCEESKICPKDRDKCVKNQRSKSCTKIDPCRSIDKSCFKPDNNSRKRHYSQLSFRSNSLSNNRSYSTFAISDIRRNNVFPRFYSDSSKEEFCGKPDTKPKKYEKIPAKCLSKKLPAETCQPITGDTKSSKRNLEEHRKQAKGKSIRIIIYYRSPYFYYILHINN